MINLFQNNTILRLKNMIKQDNLIGKCPITPNTFGKWLISNYFVETAIKCHRELMEQEKYRRSVKTYRIVD